ncbi:MAG: HEPN domain-containing protein [Gammaproteobacteria bacterium]|nr:HEPN domain-containing protein [Gammaproteobacteria bacterium]MDE0463404.1 HEPN domain-containing protein [Caldilineaceae bacterium]
MNDAEFIVQEAQRWLRFAAEDLDAARRLLADRSSAPRHVCWHSQQAAERALKAALVLEGIDFPFTHDLNALRNLLPDSWPVREDLAELTGWAVQARYPGQWPEPSAADAVRAESEARAVHNVIEAEFRSRGL